MGSAHSRLWTVCVSLSFHAIVFAFLWWKQRKFPRLQQGPSSRDWNLTDLFIREKNDTIVEIMVNCDDCDRHQN